MQPLSENRTWFACSGVQAGPQSSGILAEGLPLATTGKQEFQHGNHPR
jgi:hypothetical protein